MKQRAVITFFMLKGLKTKDIRPEAESVYGPDALARLTVKKCRRLFQHGRTDLFDDPGSGMPLTNHLGEAIGSMLAEKPFSPWKDFCCHFRIGKTTRMRMLHDMVGSKKRHLCWVPHVLSINQKNERVSDSNPLWTSLMEHRAADFERASTGDEPSFVLDCLRDSIWAASRDELPQRIKQKIDTEKCWASIL
jgi:hypothetical protein